LLNSDVDNTLLWQDMVGRNENPSFHNQKIQFLYTNYLERKRLNYQDRLDIFNEFCGVRSKVIITFIPEILK
jgi:hypothetical protein